MNLPGRSESKLDALAATEELGSSTSRARGNDHLGKSNYVARAMSGPRSNALRHRVYRGGQPRHRPGSQAPVEPPDSSRQASGRRRIGWEVGNLDEIGWGEDENLAH